MDVAPPPEEHVRGRARAAHRRQRVVVLRRGPRPRGPRAGPGAEGAPAGLPRRPAARGEAIPRAAVRRRAPPRPPVAPRRRLLLRPPDGAPPRRRPHGPPRGPPPRPAVGVRAPLRGPGARGVRGLRGRAGLMRLLYGVVGEGMGHATRSRVVIGHLLARGHEVRVLVSGRAFRFLETAFRGRAGIEVREIAGLVLAYRGNAMDPVGTVRENLRGAAAKIRRNLDAVAAMAEEGFEPRAVFSDYDSWTYLYGRSRRIPVVAVDNIQALRRLRHPREITAGLRADFAVARAATALRLPGAWHYLVPTFFHPPVSRPRTTLVPPVLREAILAAR